MLVSPHSDGIITHTQPHIRGECGFCFQQLLTPFGVAGNQRRELPASSRKVFLMPTHCRNCGKEVAERAVVCVACGLRPHDGNQFCPACAAPTQAAAVVCVKCGIPLTTTKCVKPAGPPQPKDPITMGLLGLIQGLGQIICGQVAKGLALLILTPIAIVLLGVATVGLSFFVSPVVPIVTAVDAYLVAKKLKEGNAVGDWEFFPK